MRYHDIRALNHSIFHTVYFVRSSADGFVQRHIVNVVARVGIVGIIVVRFIHTRRLGVEERRQFLKQTKEFFVPLKMPLEINALDEKSITPSRNA